MLDLPPKNGNANEVRSSHHSISLPFHPKTNKDKKQKPPITNQINILALMKATAIRKKLEKQGVHKVVIDAYLAGQMELIKEYFGELLAGGGGVVRVEDQAFGELLAGGGGVVRVEDQDFGERKQKKEKEEGGEGAAGDEDVDEKVEGGEVSAGGEPVDEKVKGEAADREGDGGRKDAA